MVNKNFLFIFIFIYFLFFIFYFLIFYFTVCTYTVHPGLVNTEIFRDDREYHQTFQYTSEEGAATQVMVASDPSLQSKKNFLKKKKKNLIQKKKKR